MRLKKLRSLNYYYTSLGLVNSLKLLTFGLALPLRSKFFAGEEAEGRKHSLRFADQFQERFDSVGAHTCASGRAGIYALLCAMGIGEGDEVLITGYTCSAVAEPLLYLGIKPIYVDIDLNTFSMKPTDARKLISHKTKAIVIQHTYGKAADVQDLLAIANEFSLRVIEDCALALGSKANGRLLGTFGDASIFSFEISKTISVGWGGIVLVNSDAKLSCAVSAFLSTQGSLSIAESSRRLLQAGLSGILYMPQIYRVGGRLASALFKSGIFRKSSVDFNRKIIPKDYLKNPPDIQWLVLNDLLSQLDRVNNKQRVNSAILDKINPLCGSAYNDDTVLIRYPLLVRNKDRFMDLFQQNGIEVGQWFSHPISSADNSHLYDYSEGSCRAAEFAAAHIVNLPTHERVTRQDLDLMLELLEIFFRDHPEEVEFFSNARQYM